MIKGVERSTVIKGSRPEAQHGDVDEQQADDDTINVVFLHRAVVSRKVRGNGIFFPFFPVFVHISPLTGLASSPPH